MPARKANGGGSPIELVRFPVTWVQEAVLNLETRAIVKGLIEPGSFGLVYGPPGSGKSFFTADIAQAIATGGMWRGRKTHQSLVVYVAAEAGSSILRRFIAWRDGRLGESSGHVPLAILTKGPSLLASLQLEALCEQLIDLEIKAEYPLGLVVFDTLSRSIPGGDENKAEDMTMVVAAADRIREQFRAATIYVHHSGKDVGKGARGHSALSAAADTVLQISDQVGTIEKVRDGVAGEKFPFKLEVVELGYDSDGDPVTTCLIQAIDQIPETSLHNKRRKPVGKNQRVVWAVFEALAKELQNACPGTSEIPAGALMVKFPDLVERASPKFPDEQGFRVREKIKDAVMGLQAAEFLGVNGEILWHRYR